MKLTYEGLHEEQPWKEAGIRLPGYDAEKLAEKTKNEPVWVHFGIGNIFRIFIGSIADRMLEEHLLDRGLTCVESFDYEVVDKIYRPFDNLGLSVILRTDGTEDKKVLGCFSEAIKGDSREGSSWDRLKQIFRAPGLQLVSFTITEKGYALKDSDGNYFSFVQDEISAGPDGADSTPAIIAAMLRERYLAGKYPLALVSMDNCSHNGELLRSSVIEIAEKWKEQGFVDEGCLEYICNEDVIAFPWTMIDKITPRPEDSVQKDLSDAGVENMDIVVTGRRTYIAPFSNAEEPQYLVVEDHFPNGRPPFERAGVYMADRNTVNKSERMKVSVCLNPIHSALAPYGMLLGYNLFADTMLDPQLHRLAEKVGLEEGMEFVEDPKSISPVAFITECLEVRFPNRYLGDTCARICTDESQGLSIRFGANINACHQKYGTAEKLEGIALGIAGWLRYILAVDDNGNEYELAPDPLAPVYHETLSSVKLGDPASADGLLRPVLSNRNVFGSDLYESGIGDRIESIFKEEIAGKGAVRETLVRHLGNA